MSNDSFILLVDDNQELLEDFSQILQLENYAIVSANDGREAIDRISEQPPDLIICDVMMPHMTGIEFYQWLQSKKILAQIPFIFITGDEQQIESLSHVPPIVLQKPVTIDELLKAIANALETPSDD